MNFQLLLTVALSCASFVVVASITPGPNNIMLAMSAANFGFRRTLPHLLGVSTGFAILLTACGLGLGTVFVNFPTVFNVMRVLGAIYMLYLGWKLFSSSIQNNQTDIAQPLTFIQAALFQWVNPKAWLMAIGVFSSFALTGESYWFSVTAIILTFTLLGFPCSLSWVVFGQSMQLLLQNQQKQLLFNYIMALLLLFTIVYMFLN